MVGGLRVLFGGDDDYAVAGAGAVECRGCGVLEHVDAVDVFGVDAADGVAYVVDVVGVVELVVADADGVLEDEAVEYPEGLPVAYEGGCASDAHSCGGSGLS